MSQDREREREPLPRAVAGVKHFKGRPGPALRAISADVASSMPQSLNCHVRLISDDELMHAALCF